MTYALIIGGCLAVAAILVASQGVRIYNRLVRLDHQCENGFSQIEIQLRRRYDLIPNLVEAVRGYLQHEQETLESVIAARNQAAQGLTAATQEGAGPVAMQQWMGAESALTGALGKLSFVMEDYPQLRANESVATLTEELRSTENRISFARQAYNDWCTTFNVCRESFPNILFAPSFGFNCERPMLEFENAEVIAEPPKVLLTTA